MAPDDRRPKSVELSGPARGDSRINRAAVTITPIISIGRRDAFDDPAFLFELKYDGFRAVADTLNHRMLSKSTDRMGRFEWLLYGLPDGFIFDGEIVALDERGQPAFNDLLFGRRDPTYLPFDVLFVEGEDVRELPLRERKAILAKLVVRYGLLKTEPFFGEGTAVFNAVCKLDLEGIVRAP